MAASKVYFTNMRVWLNFGESHRVQTGLPVTEIISSKITISMRIGLCALAIALVIGVPLGIMQARYKDGVLDAAGQAFTIGSPGGATIITTVLQTIVNHVDFNMPMIPVSDRHLLCLT